MTPPDAPQNPLTGIPEAATVQSRWSLFLVWLIPILVACIAGWLTAKAIIDRGPTITIAFKTAEGLEAGKTKIKYKNVDIGEVRSITLSDDRSMVLVNAEMTKQAERFLVKDTRFWVVRPRIAGGSVSGLSTLLSGSYIGVDAGKSQGEAEYFVGLETPPVLTQDLKGRQFILHGSDLGSLDIGSPVFFRRVEVGQVVAFSLDKDGKGVTLQVFVNAPYDQYVRTNSQFWHASGVDLNLDVNGVKLNTESLATVLIGGVAFQTPPDASSAPVAEANRLFILSADQDEAMKAPDTASETFVMVFPESVRGLSPGAPIDFRGVTLGEVAAINMDYDPATKDFAVPVEIRLYPDRLRTNNRKAAAPPADTKQILNRLVERGLRAQLRVGSLATQKLYIALDFFPDVPKAKVDWSKPLPVLPTVTGSFEELQGTLTRILKKVEKLPLDGIAKELQNTLQTLNGTLQEADKLISRIDREIAPEVRATLDSARKALGSVEGALASDTPMQHDIRETLRELTRAAQSLRDLTDYLDRHPEAILRGKKEESP